MSETNGQQKNSNEHNQSPNLELVPNELSTRRDFEGTENWDTCSGQEMIAIVLT